MSTFKKTAVLFLSSILISLLLLELILRLFVPQETKRLAIYDKDLGWRGRPNGKTVYIRKEDGINNPVEYNELGFRDDPIQPRATVSKRIAFVGDSFVENLEAPFGKTFVSIVKNRLRKSFDPKLDIVTLSSQGYSTAQELRALKKYYNVLQPDIVILFFYTGNDFEDNLRREFAYLDAQGNLVFPENNDSWLRQQILSFKRWTYESSYLVFYLKNLIESHTAIDLGDDTKKAETGSKQYRDDITKKLILEIKKYVEQQGSKFGLVLFTNKHQLRENHLENTQFVEGVCREAGLPFIEFTQTLKPEHFFKVDEHFSEAGHQLVADHVYDFLVRTFLSSTPAINDHSPKE